MARSSDFSSALYRLSAWFLGSGLIALFATGSWWPLLTSATAIAILKHVWDNLASTDRPIPVGGV